MLPVQQKWIYKEKTHTKAQAATEAQYGASAEEGRAMTRCNKLLAGMTQVSAKCSPAVWTAWQLCSKSIIYDPSSAQSKHFLFLE